MPFDKSGKRREANLNEKIKVIEGRAQGESFSKIGEKLHLSRSQASKIHKRWKTKESVNNQQRTGRPETLSDRDKRHLNRLVEANPEAILSRGRVASIPQGTKRIVEVGVGTRNRGPEGL
jgi:transposase